MIQALLPVISSLLGKTLDRAVPDADQREKLRAKIQEELLQMDRAELEAAARIVAAEAQGESWLQRSWRPIVMLTFAALIVARWLGFAAPGLSEQEYMALWDVVRIGLGGYVIGRSAEKVARSIAPALRR